MNQTHDYCIRPISNADLVAVRCLIHEHARFEQTTKDVTCPVDSLRDLLFCESPQLFGLVVEQLNEIVGYATFAIQVSTWQASRYLYLDCLFLKPGNRGHGIGRTLMNRVCDAAKRFDCDEIQLQTPAFNETAIGFYKRLGAEGAEKFRFVWRVDSLNPNLILIP